MIPIKLWLNNAWQLHECQEQSYLLDRHLESLVTPVVDRLKCYAKLYPCNGQPSRALTNKISRIADLLYYYFNFRGYKTIGQFFVVLSRIRY